MNKGLEVMEAHHLFGTPYDRIDVVVHPQSIIHALVQLCDGSTKAHMGYPDMRVAIGYALHHPDRADLPIENLDLVKLGRLDFEAPDLDAFPCLRLAREAAVAGGTAPCALNAANEIAVHAFLTGRLGFTGIPRVIEGVLEQLGSHRVHDFEALYVTDSEARELAAELIDTEVTRMSWILAFLGFAMLVILHEAGHFFAAKAVGMRVERFALFFPPLVYKFKRGETEYGVGAIPLGGYVKITGMNPAEEIPPEHAHRAYYRQPVWKRIVVIAAGPAVNIVLAFVILAGVFMCAGHGRARRPWSARSRQHARRRRRSSRATCCWRSTASRWRGNYTEQLDQVQKAVGAHKDTPVALTVRRNGREQVVSGKTFFDKKNKRYRFGFAYDQDASVAARRPAARQRPGGRGDVDGDERDRQPHRADLRAREAQGARQRRRRLRDRRARRSRSRPAPRS